MRTFIFALSVTLAGCNSRDDHAVSGADAGEDAAGGCGPRGTVPDVLTAYLAAWAETDRTRRDCLVAQSFSEDGIFLDPISDVRNAASLSDHIGSLLDSNPNFRILWNGNPEVRDADLLAPWTVEMSGTQVQVGVDYMVLAADGRIAAIHSYWDPFSSDTPTDAMNAYMDAWNAPDSVTRTASLATAVSTAVRFIDGASDVTGSAVLANTMSSARSAGLATTAPVVAQVVPGKIARMQLDLTDQVGATTRVTDYVRFDVQSQIEHVARFAGP